MFYLILNYQVLLCKEKFRLKRRKKYKSKKKSLYRHFTKKKNHTFGIYTKLRHNL